MENGMDRDARRDGASERSGETPEREGRGCALPGTLEVNVLRMVGRCLVCSGADIDLPSPPRLSSPLSLLALRRVAVPLFPSRLVVGLFNPATPPLPPSSTSSRRLPLLFFLLSSVALFSFFPPSPRRSRPPDLFLLSPGRKSPGLIFPHSGRALRSLQPPPAGRFALAR